MSVIAPERALRRCKGCGSPGRRRDTCPVCRVAQEAEVRDAARFVYRLTLVRRHGLGAAEVLGRFESPVAAKNVAQETDRLEWQDGDAGFAGESAVGRLGTYLLDRRVER